MPEKNKTVNKSKRRWPMIVGISIGGVIGVIGIIFLLIPTIISSNFSKGKVEKILGESLGREVKIGSFSMGWSSGIDIKNIFIKEREDLPGDTFVKVNRIFCDIQYRPLMKKQIKIKNLLIDSPEIVLQRDKEGILNVEDIGKSAETKPPTGKVEKHVPVAAEKPSEEKNYTPLAFPLLFEIELNAMVTNGKFTFIDHRLGEKTIIKDLNTTLIIESLVKPIEFKTTFNIEAKGKTEQANISLNLSIAKDGRIAPRSAKGIFNMETGFAQMAADFDMARFMGKGGTGLDFSLNMDLKEFTNKLAGILGLPEGLQMEGTVNSKITASGRLDKMITINGKTEMVSLHVTGGPLEGRPIRQPKVSLVQSVDIDIANDKVVIKKVGLESSFANIGLTGLITDFKSKRGFDIKLLMDCDITKLMAEVGGLLPKDTEVAGKMKTNIKLKGQQDNFEVEGETSLKDFFVKSGSIGPIKEPNIRMAFNTGHNLKDNSHVIKKLNVDTSFAQIRKSSGSFKGNSELDLNMILLAPDIKKLVDNLHGIVSLPEGLSVGGKLAEEVKVTGNIKEKIKLNGKAILLGINAAGGPLKDTKISNQDLKVLHVLEYDMPKGNVNVEQLDITSDLLNLKSKGKITDLGNAMDIVYEIFLDMDLGKTAFLFESMLPANMSVSGKSIVDLGLRGKLSAILSAMSNPPINYQDICKNINLNGNISVEGIDYGANKIRDFKTRLQMNDSLLEMKDFVFNLNGEDGKITARINLHKDSVDIEQLNIESGLIVMDSKGKITDLSTEQNIDFEISMNSNLGKTALLLEGMIPKNMNMSGKGIVDLKLNGKLSAITSALNSSTIDYLDIGKNVNLNGNISIDGIEYGTYKIRDFKTRLKLNNGILETIDLAVKLNGGGGKVLARADLNKDYVNIEQLDLTTDLAEAAVLLKDMLPANMSMSGKGIVNMVLSGKLSAILSAVNSPAIDISDVCRNINLNGNISVDGIDYDAYKITDFKTGLMLNGGFFETKDFAFKVNEGEGDLVVKANFNEARPPLDLTMNLKDVSIDQKMDALAYAIPLFSSDGQISGLLNMDVTGKGEGLDWQEELSKNVSATGKINIRDGYMKGSMILVKILKFLNKGKDYSFNDIIAAFVIKDGKIFSDDIKVNGDDFNIGLSGWTSFDGQLEYKVKKLPIAITGEVSDPKVAFKASGAEDIGGILQEFLGGKEDPEQTTGTETTEEKSQGIEGVLGGILGGGKDTGQTTGEVNEPPAEPVSEETQGIGDIFKRFLGREEDTELVTEEEVSESSTVPVSEAEEAEGIAESPEETQPEKTKEEKMVDKIFKLFK